MWDKGIVESSSERAAAGILNVVFVDPQIPQNSGSTARLCAATGSTLHLCGKLGFRTDDRYLKRAGLDYWEYVAIKQHAGFDDLVAANPAARFLCFSRHATRLYSDARYLAGDFLIFGAETTGLPGEILDRYASDCYRIPMIPGIRSLNLATSAGIVVFEALRQLGNPHVNL